MGSLRFACVGKTEKAEGWENGVDREKDGEGQRTEQDSGRLYFNVSIEAVSLGWIFC